MRKAFAFLIVVCCTSAAQATLIDRGNGMIYDNVLNITWLQDANLGGTQTWNEALDWADNLIYEGFDDWRLPSADVNMDGITAICAQGAPEAECRDNELAYMYYFNLGGVVGSPVDLSGDQGPFTNIQFFHWTSTPIPFDPNFPDFVFHFGFLFGQTVGDFDDLMLGSWGVRDGDVLAVAEPRIIVVLGLGLFILAWSRRSRAAPQRCKSL